MSDIPSLEEAAKNIKLNMLEETEQAISTLEWSLEQDTKRLAELRELYQKLCPHEFTDSESSMVFCEDCGKNITEDLPEPDYDREIDD